LVEQSVSAKLDCLRDRLRRFDSTDFELTKHSLRFVNQYSNTLERHTAAEMSTAPEMNQAQLDPHVILAKCRCEAEPRAGQCSRIPACIDESQRQ
jgi:hypothetical protein